MTSTVDFLGWYRVERLIRGETDMGKLSNKELDDLLAVLKDAKQVGIIRDHGNLFSPKMIEMLEKRFNEEKTP